MVKLVLIRQANHSQERKSRTSPKVSSHHYNLGAITKAVQPSISIYRKFDKARYIIDSRAIKNNTPIRFSGSCYLTIEGYEVFDLLPFILLENAVKYTQSGMEIVVIFNSVAKTVEISNVGPKVKNERSFIICFRK